MESFDELKQILSQGYLVLGISDSNPPFTIVKLKQFDDGIYPEGEMPVYDKSTELLISFNGEYILVREKKGDETCSIEILLWNLFYGLPIIKCLMTFNLDENFFKGSEKVISDVLDGLHEIFNKNFDQFDEAIKAYQAANDDQDQDQDSYTYGTKSPRAEPSLHHLDNFVPNSFSPNTKKFT